MIIAVQLLALAVPQKPPFCALHFLNSRPLYYEIGSKGNIFISSYLTLYWWFTSLILLFIYDLYNYR